MNILKKYFETEAGQTRPSKSIKTIARIFYWFYLIMGVVALVGCLLATLNTMDYNHEAGYLYLVIAVLCPFVCKLIGWLTSLSLRAIAVVVESHEKNLDLQPEVDHIQVAVMEKATEAAKKSTEVAGRVSAMAEKVPEAVGRVSAAVKSALTTQEKPAVDGWVCKSCGASNPKHIGTCPECGATK